MATHVRQVFYLLFLTMAVLTSGSARVSAADCTDFVNHCSVQAVGNYIQYSCDGTMTCDQVFDCIQEACPGVGTDISCNGACSPEDGPCGSGQCVPE